jgi:hypothetical protein
MGIFTSTKPSENLGIEGDLSPTQSQRHSSNNEGILNSNIDKDIDGVFKESRGAPVSGVFDDLSPVKSSSLSQSDSAACERSASEKKESSVLGRMKSWGDSLSANSYFNAKGLAACGLTVVGVVSSVLYFPALAGAGALLGWAADRALAPIFKEKSESQSSGIKRKIASWIFSEPGTEKRELSEVGKFLVENNSLGPKVVGMVTLAGLGIASGGILGMASIIGAGAAAYFVCKPGSEKPIAPRLAGGLCIAGMAAASVGMPGLGILAFGAGFSAIVGKPLLSVVRTDLDKPKKNMEV